ncbi:acyltransferase family protein [Vibrio tubiashii]|uniref:acyltransferase family protein n=1 Tax=Vibrio tubiashii TaxID=29498 RepID=UPI00349EE511
MEYRKDINALRALAVIAVVMYHFDSSLLAGGFIGVDIFFVISGYLMTRIIFSKLESERFCLISFYLNRARRIIPPLTFLCFSLLLFGFLFVSPLNLEPLGKHVLSSLIFISNITYLQDGGYFDTNNHLNWLLHTWSLSVEWQFYILYPILIFFVRKLLSEKYVKITLVMIFIISYILSLMLTYLNPNFSYYNLITRTWEMLAGGLAYLYPFKIRKKGTFNFFGLSLIIFSCFFVSSEDLWPGYLASIPVFGTYLLIISERKNSVIADNAIVSLIGKWSYSIYLWHWPLVILGSFYDFDNWTIIGISVSVILGGVSYNLIEKPPFNYKSKHLFTFYIFVIIFSSLTILTNGFEDRVEKTYRLTGSDYHQEHFGGTGYPTNTIIHINSGQDDYDIAIVGDSYAQQYASSIDKSNVKTIGLFEHGCLILPNYSIWSSRVNSEIFTCSQEFNKIKNKLKGNNKPLIIAQYWDGYQTSLTKKGTAKALNLSNDEYMDIIESDLYDLFERLGNRHYFIIGTIQSSSVNAYLCLSSKSLLGYKLFNLSCNDEQLRKEIPINSMLHKLGKTLPNVTYIDPNDILCGYKTCKTIINGTPVHTDGYHLSKYSSDTVFDYIMSKIELKGFPLK